MEEQEFKYTQEQRAVVDHPDNRHARVLAGPGTGKSITLVGLVGRQLEVDPDRRVRMLTFTRTATAELEKKIPVTSTKHICRPSTIHSFAISILLANPGAAGLPHPLRIADNWETDELVAPHLACLLGVKKSVLGDLVVEMSSNWESLADELDGSIPVELRSRFLAVWREHRRIFGYSLLAELPFALLQALKSHGSDLNGVSFDMLVVDEYQDLNACDLTVLRCMTDLGATLVAAGDDDQSIYGFRKAHPEGIRRFLDDYTNAADYPLTIAHRCGKRILKWASYVIQGDPDRDLGKKAQTCSPESPDGCAALLHFPGHVAEAKGIAQLAKLLTKKHGIPESEILVLLRSDHNGAFSGPIKREMDSLGIACSDPDVVLRLLNADHNRCVIEMFRLVADQHDSLAWAGLLTLTHGIGPAFVNSIYERARTSGLSFAEELLSSYENGFADDPKAPAGKASDLIDSVIAWLGGVSVPDDENERVPWGEWIAVCCRETGIGPLDDELLDLLSRIDEEMEDNLDLGRYVALIAPLGKDILYARSPGIRIMSLTAAKGLTVQAAIIGSVEENIIPANHDLREERRLLYVGMTRAKEFLYCTWARRRRGPTARAGIANVGELRNHSHLFLGGPVSTEDGQQYLDAQSS